VIVKKKKKDGCEVLLRVFIFGSFWFLSKKSNQIEIEPKPVQTDRFWFRFLEQKPVQTGLTWFFRFDSFWLVFFRFGSVFFRFGFCSVFSFKAYKTETEPVGFFKILIGSIGFFSRFGFFGYFFSGFLGLIGFSVFLLTLRYCDGKMEVVIEIVI